MREPEDQDLYTDTFVFSDQKEPEKQIRPDKGAIVKHSILFILTFASVSFTVVAWGFIGHNAIAESLMDLILWEGVLFATLFLGFLGAHEFGHYFAAVYHRIKTTLPFFVPVPIISPIGTVGAVIRIKERIDETKKLFDIGVAGPVAGFVVSIAVLLIGFFTLPEPEYIANFAGHDNTLEYIQEHGTFPDEPLPEESEQLMVLGNTLLYDIMASFFEDSPPLWEVYHYPFLFAGWLGLFFTALNLMPVGQLDGGHILYALVGYRKHRLLARLFFACLVALGGAGAMPHFQAAVGGLGGPPVIGAWLVWALVSFLLLRKAYRSHSLWTLPAWLLGLGVTGLLIYGGFFPEDVASPLLWLFWSILLVFFIGIEHPPVTREVPLTQGRKILGWASMAIFFLCISPNPIYFLN